MTASTSLPPLSPLPAVYNNIYEDQLMASTPAKYPLDLGKSSSGLSKEASISTTHSLSSGRSILVASAQSD